MKNNEKIAVHIPDILLPKNRAEIYKWAVVACDQYTSQPEYWESVSNITKNAESTLHMIFPEVYLEHGDEAEKILEINQTMDAYLKSNIFDTLKNSMIYIDRKTSHAESRKGLIMALDLEKYDFNKGSQTLIRATEGTVIDRLPPRIKIRENAPLELPHIMVLIDDPERTVIEPIANNHEKLEKLYDFDLMMNSGHIKGYKVDDEKTLDIVISALEKLAEKNSFQSKYNVGEDKGVLLFAVGDGNHSLASAKCCWENLKKTLTPEEASTHPARYALVEIVNVHDDGLKFEPIHRVIFNVDGADLLDNMVKFWQEKGCEVKYQFTASSAEARSEIEKISSKSKIHVIPFVMKEKSGYVTVSCPVYNLEVGTLQSFLDDYSAKNKNMKIDYIHGDEVVSELGSKEGNIGFFLPPMDKHDLFKTVIVDGVLPRKTFSMGEADEKRFYLECRKIR